MALINNVVEIRTDAYKLLVNTTRVPYKCSNGIGIWYQLMEVLGIVGVLTNCMLIVFSQRTLFDLSGQNMLLAFGAAIVLEVSFEPSHH